MTNTEAIETLRANYPDACYEQLREAVDEAIRALKAQDAAGDTISRQAAIGTVKHLREVCDTDDINDYYDLMLEAFNVLPPAQPERKTGKWNRDADGLVWCGTCSYGKERSDKRPYRFCPNCGVMMEEGDTP